MAVRTISNAGGNWNATTSWVEGAVPTAADDVVATATSGPLTINVAALCRSINLTNYVSTLTHAAAVTLTIGDGTAGAGNVALKFVAGMTYTLTQVTSAIAFVSTSATQQTVTTAGKTLGNTTFNGAGGSWLLSDGMTLVSSTGILTFSAGTLNTNGQTCSFGSFVTNSNLTRTLTLGSSAITLTTTGADCFNNRNGATGLTITTNTAVITIPSSPSVGMDAINYNGLSIVANNSIGFGFNSGGGTITLRNVTIAPSAAQKNVSAGVTFSSLTCTGTLTLTGFDDTCPLVFDSNTGANATVTLTAAVVSLTRVIFTNVVGAGAAAPFTGTLLGDWGGNSNITFTASTTQTFAGGTKNWDDVTAWTSRIPLPQDDVVIAAAGTLTVNMRTGARNWDFTGFAGTCTLNTASALGIRVMGNLLLAAGMTFTDTGTFNPIAFAGRGAQTITSNGKAFPPNSDVNFQAVTGTYTLLDAMTTNSSRTVFLVSGTLNTNGQACSWGSFTTSVGTTRTMTLGASAITIAGSFNLANSAGLTWTANTAVVTMTSTGQFGAGFDYNGMSLVASNPLGLNINGQSTANLILKNLTLAPSTPNTRAGMTITNLTTLTITGTLTFTGANPGLSRLMVQSSNPGGTNTTITAAAVSLQNVDFRRITGAGVAAPFTGTAIGDARGNSGITFTPSAPQAFIGGTKNWSDVTAWTSRVPLPQDDVTISGAGSITGDCRQLGRSIDFTGFTGTFTPTVGGGTGINVYGSFTLSAAMTYTSGGQDMPIAFLGDGANTLTTAGHTMLARQVVSIDALTGSYTLQDDLVINTVAGNANIQLLTGTLASNGKNVTTTTFSCSNGFTSVVAMGNGGTWTLTSTGTVWGMGNQTTVTGFSTIVISDTSATAKTFSGASQSYGTLRYVAAGSGPLTITGNNTFQTLDLECATARTITFPASGTQIVRSSLVLTGAAGQLLSLVSSTPGTQTTIIPTGTVTNTNTSISADVVIRTPVSNTIVASVEMGQALTVTLSSPLEAGSSVAQALLTAVEALGGAAKVVTPPLEALSALVASSTAPVETFSGVSTTASVPVESPGAVIQAAVAALEAVGLASRVVAVPLEALAPAGVVVVAPLEAFSGVAALVGAPIEWVFVIVQNLTDPMIVQLVDASARVELSEGGGTVTLVEG